MFFCWIFLFRSYVTQICSVGQVCYGLSLHVAGLKRFGLVLSCHVASLGQVCYGLSLHVAGLKRFGLVLICHVASLGQVCYGLNLHREGLNRFDLVLIRPAQVGLVLQLVRIWLA
jgi:hypothetical protein